MPAKGKGRGLKKVPAEKTQENVVDSTTNQKAEEKIDATTTIAQSNVDKKSVVTKRKQNKKDIVENGDAPTVPEKRGRGRPGAAATKTTEQPAPVSPVSKQEEQELPPEKQQTKGKRGGGKKGAALVPTKPAVVVENETKEKDESKEEESEPEIKTVVASSNDDDKPVQAKRGRKKALATTETENGVKKVEHAVEPQKDVKGGGRRGATVAAKKEKQAANGNVEKAIEPVKKGRGAKAKKEIENGFGEEKNAVKTIGGKKTAVAGGRGRKRAAAAIDVQEEISEQQDDSD